MRNVSGQIDYSKVHYELALAMAQLRILRKLRGALALLEVYVALSQILKTADFFTGVFALGATRPPMHICDRAAPRA